MFDILKEDFKLNSFRSFTILFFYRTMYYCYRRENHFFLKILNIFYFFIKWIFSLDAQISYKARIGRGIRLPHMAFGVVVSAKAKIGNNVTIYHLVTIGINENKCLNIDNICVEIGDNTYIGAGAKIINAKVGKNCKIGANAVVYKNLPDNTIVVNKVEYK